MNNLPDILRRNPFFRHCNHQEIGHIASLVRMSHINRGQEIDLRKLNAVNIVLEGLFELESSGKKEQIYLTPGACFGDFPFTDGRNRGMVKALSDARMLHLNNEDLYKFFFMNYKALRGFIRSAEGFGLDISAAGKSIYERKARIITVFSTGDKTGKSLFSACLSLALAKTKRTIILDMSYAGNSVFNIFGKKLTPPLSQKLVESSTGEQQISERIEDITDRLSLINIIQGSQIKSNPSILSPLLIALSKSYDYIIIDLSNSDPELRDRVFELSDFVCGLVKKIKERKQLFDLFDDRISGGQRVFYILNSFFDDSSVVTGAYRWGQCTLSVPGDNRINFEGMIESVNTDLIKRIQDKIKALVLESSHLNTIPLAGFYAALLKENIMFDLHYSSGPGFIPVSFYLQSANDVEYEKKILDTFSEEKLSEILKITFPKEYIYKNSGIRKLAAAHTRNERMEFYQSQALMLASDTEGSNRLFSTGFLHDLITVSGIINPLFETIQIGNRHFHSGYPQAVCRREDLHRLITDDVLTVSIDNSGNFSGKVRESFYSRLISMFALSDHGNAFNYPGAHCEIKITEGTDDPKEIFKIAEKASIKYLKEKYNR